MKTPTHDPLIERAKTLQLHGLISHWEEIGQTGWIESLIQWEEQ